MQRIYKHTALLGHHALIDVEITENLIHLNASATFCLSSLVRWSLVPRNLHLQYFPSSRCPCVTVSIMLQTGVRRSCGIWRWWITAWPRLRVSKAQRREAQTSVRCCGTCGHWNHAWGCWARCQGDLQTVEQKWKVSIRVGSLWKAVNCGAEIQLWYVWKSREAIRGGRTVKQVIERALQAIMWT